MGHTAVFAYLFEDRAFLRTVSSHLFSIHSIQLFLYQNNRAVITSIAT